MIPSHISHGSPEMLLAHIAERMAVVQMRAAMAIDHAELGDRFGLTRSLRLASIEFKAALGLLVELEEENIRDQERRRARKAAGEIA